MDNPNWHWTLPDDDNDHMTLTDRVDSAHFGAVSISLNVNILIQATPEEQGDHTHDDRCTSDSHTGRHHVSEDFAIETRKEIMRRLLGMMTELGVVRGVKTSPIVDEMRARRARQAATAIAEAMLEGHETIPLPDDIPDELREILTNSETVTRRALERNPNAPKNAHLN